MNANELADRLIDYHDSFLAKDCATMLRQQQDLLDGYHKQSLDDSRAISKLVGEMAGKEAEIEALKSKYETPHTPTKKLSHAEIGKLLGKEGY